MKSGKRGNATLRAEVEQVSNRGMWLYLAGTQTEYYLSFEDFPWFREATFRQLSTIEVERDHIVRWPQLDVDLDLDRIENPKRYPLLAQQPKKLLRVSDSRRSVRSTRRST